mgnify:CR=1 FL=1
MKREIGEEVAEDDIEFMEKAIGIRYVKSVLMGWGLPEDWKP